MAETDRPDRPPTVAECFIAAKVAIDDGDYEKADALRRLGESISTHG